MNTDKQRVTAAQQQVFAPEDLVDVPAIIAKLNDGSVISTYLHNKFTRAGKRMLKGSGRLDEQRLRMYLCQEINTIAIGPLIFHRDIPADLHPRKYTMRALKRFGGGGDPAVVNRLILQDVFGAAISRPWGRGKSQEQKPAVVSKRKLASGNYAVFLNLLRGRILLGRHERPGRKKWERQTAELARSLCLEINAELYNRKLERELTPHEAEVAKELVFRLERDHPEWLEHLTEAIQVLEAMGWEPAKDSVPTLREAAEIFWREVVSSLEPATQFNYRVALSFVMKPFGDGPPINMSDMALRKLANGSDPVTRLTTEVPIDRLQGDRLEKHLWVKEVPFRGKRPWTKGTKRRFLACVRAFRNWMHSSEDPVTEEPRNWGPESKLKLPALKDKDFHPAPVLTVEQAQAILDVAFVAFDGRIAAFVVDALLSGGRVSEIKRNYAGALNAQEASVSVPEEVAKTDVARTSYLTENTVIMAEALRKVGLYERRNHNPTQSELATLKILAGFKMKDPKAMARAEREGARLKACGIELPIYNWGISFPRNGLRRTGINMHRKLFDDLLRTADWAGTSKTAIEDWYKREMSKQQSRTLALMLPSWWRGQNRPRVRLPEGHKLDVPDQKVHTANVRAAVRAIRALTSQMAEAEKRLKENREVKQQQRRREYGREYIREYRRKHRSDIWPGR